MQRRTFLSSTILTVTGMGCAGVKKSARQKVVTVNGEIAPLQLGTTLPHEHILVDFIGWKQATKDRYDEDHAYQAVLPKLQEIKALGCDSYVDCTPAYLGRDPKLLQRLSTASGLHIVTNTGIYAARNYQHVPDYAKSESAEQIARRWIEEFQNGIGSTGIRPGFIKSGVNSELQDLDRKLIRSCCITSNVTGLPFAIHTGKGTISEQTSIIEAEGTPLSKFIWTHCQNEGDIDLFTMAAEKGVWLSLDGAGLRSAEQYLGWLKQLKERNLLHNVLLSQDSGWYDPAKPGGGVVRSYAYLFTHFIPLMKENGFTEEDIEMITINNPQTSFSLKI